MAQHLHQPGFDSAPIQFSEHVQNAHQAACFFIAESRTRYPAAVRPTDAISRPYPAPIRPNRGTRARVNTTVVNTVAAMIGICGRKQRAAVIAKPTNAPMA